MKSQIAAPFSCLAGCPEAQYVDVDTCKACSPSCASCTGGAENKCTNCISGRLRSAPGPTFSCVATCADGRFDDNGTCMPCDPSCLTCFGQMNNQCVSCPPNILRNLTPTNLSCVSKCPTKTYLVGDTCMPCKPTCPTCSGELISDCTSCMPTRIRSGTGLKFSCLSGCPTGFYDNSGVCALCDPSCKTCTGPASNNCSSCNQGNYFSISTNICSTTRPLRNYCDHINQKGDDYYRCDYCYWTCETCSKSTLCNSCIDGYE